MSFVLVLYVHWTSFPEWIPTQCQQFIVGSLMRQHHPASLPFFSVCINGANRNYQTSRYSLKPSCGNCHWTTLQQGSGMTSAGIKGFAGGSHVQNMTALQCLCCGLGPVTCWCPIVWRLSCSHTGWKHTQHGLPRRPQAKQFSEWGHIVTHTRHALVAVHAHCLHGLL